MQMRQRDEEKRSKAWVIVMAVSSIVIIGLVVFFATRSVYGNPLEGEWVEADKGYEIEIDDDEISVEAMIDGKFVDVDFYYTLDKTDKILTLKPHLNAYAKAALDSEGKLTASEIDEAMKEFVASYNYSLEGETLTLTEREFGNQYVFTRIEK